MKDFHFNDFFGWNFGSFPLSLSPRGDPLQALFLVISVPPDIVNLLIFSNNHAVWVIIMLPKFRIRDLPDWMYRTRMHVRVNSFSSKMNVSCVDRGYQLLGPLASLEWALLRLALRLVTDRGYQLVSVPDLLPAYYIVYIFSFLDPSLFSSILLSVWDSYAHSRGLPRFNQLTKVFFHNIKIFNILNYFAIIHFGC